MLDASVPSANWCSALAAFDAADLGQVV